MAQVPRVKRTYSKFGDLEGTVGFEMENYEVNIRAQPLTNGPVSDNYDGRADSIEYLGSERFIIRSRRVTETKVSFTVK